MYEYFRLILFLGQELLDRSIKRSALNKIIKFGIAAVSVPLIIGSIVLATSSANAQILATPPLTTTVTSAATGLTPSASLPLVSGSAIDDSAIGVPDRTLSTDGDNIQFGSTIDGASESSTN